MNRVPLSIALLTTFAGVALIYMALQGFGLITGTSLNERVTNLKASIQS